MKWLGVVCRVALVAVAVGGFSIVGGAAGAHGGGLDANGGHHCREAGYRSGKCAPLGSYHCHRPGCVEPGARPPEPEPVEVVPLATPEPEPTPPPTLTPEPTAEPTAVVTAEPPLEATEEASESLGIGETIVVLALLAGMGYGILRVVRSIQGRRHR